MVVGSVQIWCTTYLNYYNILVRGSAELVSCIKKCFTSKNHYILVANSGLEYNATYHYKSISYLIRKLILVEQTVIVKFKFAYKLYKTSYCIFEYTTLVAFRT